jgi:hypothetical protein
MTMAKLCNLKGCKKPPPHGALFCHSHRTKVNINSFLSNTYRAMKRRTKGNGTKRPDLYKGLPIMPKEVFLNWAKNHPDFLRLYKQWVSCDFDRKLTPTVNRLKSNKGYTLDNVEWLTNSQNCSLAGSVRSMKMKKEIYELLGVNSNVKK